MAKYVAVKLAYESYEPPGGGDKNLSPIIFLHGSASSKEDWTDVPQVIADGSGRKIYTVDARNHGDSEYTKDFNLDMNVVDLFHFMDTINLPKAVLVGHSMGGITAIKAALEKPERIDMVFIEDIHMDKLTKEIFEGSDEFFRLWELSLENTPKGLSPLDAAAYAKDYFCQNLLKDENTSFNEEVVRKWTIKLKISPQGDYITAFNREALSEAFRNPDTIMTAYKGQFDGPAFFIYGSESHFKVYKNEENIKKHFPKAELIKFDGATHFVHLEFPVKFTETVLQHLQ